MGRNRLKRLKFHSQLCVATLTIVLFAGYVRISGSILNALIAAAIALACCIVLKGTDVGISRQYLFRHLLFSERNGD